MEYLLAEDPLQPSLRRTKQTLVVAVERRMLHQLQEFGPAHNRFAVVAFSPVAEATLQEAADAQPPESKFRVQPCSNRRIQDAETVVSGLP
jgi:hypothetical protein